MWPASAHGVLISGRTSSRLCDSLRYALLSFLFSLWRTSRRGHRFHHGASIVATFFMKKKRQANAIITSFFSFPVFFWFWYLADREVRHADICSSDYTSTLHCIHTSMQRTVSLSFPHMTTPIARDRSACVCVCVCVFVVVRRPAPSRSLSRKGINWVPAVI